MLFQSILQYVPEEHSIYFTVRTRRTVYSSVTGIAVHNALLISMLFQSILQYVPEEHSTPASSLCLQSFVPHPAKEHWSILFSNPEHVTLSIQIWAKLGAVPNPPAGTETDPSL